MEKLASKISFTLLYLVAILLGVTLLKEPDLWWIITSGEWIVTHLKIPKTDVFSYSFEGQPWVNVKWLYEVLAYAWTKIFGVDLLPLIQSLANVLMVFFVFKLYSLISKKPISNSFEMIIPLGIALMAMSFRMTGRPELVSHLFTVISLFLWQNIRSGRQSAFWQLLLLQVFWVNLHEAYPVGLVISGAMAFGIFLEHKFYNPTNSLNLKRVIGLAVLNYLVCAIHPLHVYMLAQPFEIFSQLQKNQYTNELFGIKTTFFWSSYQAYLAIGLLMIVLVWLASQFKLGFKNVLFNSGGFGYWLVVLLFVFLATTAHRNLPFLFISLVPLLALTFDAAFKKVKTKSIVLWANVVFLLGAYFFITTNTLYQYQGEKEEFGLGISTLNHPVKAAEFIAQNNIEGVCYADFLVSSYLLWELRPNFKTLIDFRDLDVFSNSFFDGFILSTQNPDRFESFDQQFNFDYVVLYRNQFENLHRYLYQNQHWQPVFADAVAAVYIKKSGINGSKIIDQTDEVFNQTFDITKNKLAIATTKILWPFYQDTVPKKAEKLLGAEYYTMVGDYEKAEQMAKQGITEEPKNVEIPLQLAKIYFEAGKSSAGNQQANLYNKSATVYAEILKNLPNHQEALFGMGYLYYQAGNAVDAQSVLKKLLRENPNHFNAHVVLADCQNLFMKADPSNSAGYAKKWFEYMLKAHEINSEDDLTSYKLGVSYCQRNQCNEAKKYLKGLHKLLQLSEAENQLLIDCKKKCLN